MKSDTFERVYVDVKAAFNASGNLIPLDIRWVDGKVYEIDKVTDVRQAAAMKAGGQGDRYEVWIRGKQSYLFFERSGALSGNNLGRFFVEHKND
jgi:hypothetical protein